MTYKCLHGMAPTYLSDLLQPKGASIINLRSNTNLNLLAIPRTNLCSSGDREFATASPKEWNKLPMAIQASENLDTFKRKLKTFLFANCHF